MSSEGPWTAIVASALTGISTLAAVWLSSRSSRDQLKLRLAEERARSQGEAHRQRIEELYELLERWANEMVIHFATFRKVMRGEIEYDVALDLTIQRGAMLQATRLFTLAELYFPEEDQLLGELKSIRDKAASVLGDFKRHYQNGSLTSDQHADAITALLTNFNMIVDRYRTRLVERIRAL